MEHDQIVARLRLALDRQAARHEISPGAWLRIEGRLRRRTRRRLAIAAVCLAVAAGVVTPFLLHSSTGPAVGHPHRRLPQLILGSRTHLSHGALDITTGFGGVWVIGSGVVYRVDPATARTVATIRAPGVGTLNHIAAGAGAVWTTSDDNGHFGVYRIDPRHNRVTAFIPLRPDPIGITVAYDRVWVSEPRSGPGVVVRIDPQTDHVIGPPIGVGVGAGTIVPGAGALWVTDTGEVSRINPATGVVTRTLLNISDVSAVGTGSLWVISDQGGVERVDPATGHVTATIAVPNAARVTLWAGSAWVSQDQSGTVTRIDPASNRVVGEPAAAGSTPIYVAASPSGLWVIDAYTADLLHFELASRHTGTGPDRMP